jgi:Ca2+/Na+ antiporter
MTRASGVVQVCKPHTHPPQLQHNTWTLRQSAVCDLIYANPQNLYSLVLYVIFMYFTAARKITTLKLVILLTFFLLVAKFVLNNNYIAHNGFTEVI